MYFVNRPATSGSAAASSAPDPPPPPPNSPPTASAASRSRNQPHRIPHLRPWRTTLRPRRQRLKFATYYRDQTGLDYTSRGCYSNNWGRFSSADPIGSYRDRFSYAELNPINHVGVTGLYACFTGWGVDVCGDHVGPTLTLAGQWGTHLRVWRWRFHRTQVNRAPVWCEPFLSAAKMSSAANALDPVAQSKEKPKRDDGKHYWKRHGRQGKVNPKAVPPIRCI